MDRLAGSAPLPLNAPTRIGAVQGDLVRILDLVVGDKLQATVAAVLGQGRVLLGLGGGLVEATSHVELATGQAYEFTVASTKPRIILSTARPLLIPGLNAATASGLLGPASPAIDLIGDILQRTEPASSMTAGAGVEGDGLGEPLESAVASLRRGAPTAADLRLLQKHLGHDQELRVLRLAQQTETRAEVKVLQHTLKAAALRVLEKANDAGSGPHSQAAKELISALNSIEVENVRRSEQGAPQWLPLPVAEEGELRHARMFLLPGPDDEATEGRHRAGRPFTVVLLLDFTSLGQIRVDLQMRGSTLSVTIVAVESSAVHSLVADVSVLRERLEAGGLEVRSLTVRSAPAEHLPIADLVIRPTGSTSMVDIHA